MNTTSLPPNKAKNARKIIVALSIVIPIAVAILFKVHIDGVDLSFLPPFYAGLNGTTSLLLIAALVAIKKGNIAVHQKLIQTCLGISLLFLLCYVAYHATSSPTSYGGTMKALYYFILISHVILSIAVIPVVLFTYLFAWEGDYQKHKRWTKIAFPIWLYVAVTGVIVYIMISPFYA